MRFLQVATRGVDDGEPGQLGRAPARLRQRGSGHRLCFARGGQGLVPAPRENERLTSADDDVELLLAIADAARQLERLPAGLDDLFETVERYERDHQVVVRTQGCVREAVLEGDVQRRPLQHKCLAQATVAHEGDRLRVQRLGKHLRKLELLGEFERLLQRRRRLLRLAGQDQKATELGVDPRARLVRLLAGQHLESLFEPGRTLVEAALIPLDFGQVRLGQGCGVDIASRLQQRDRLFEALTGNVGQPSAPRHQARAVQQCSSLHR
ncbi:MAG TPA: hypothetical protein VF137_07205 [Candidatus Dormibacteraeota bacterium]